MEEGGDSIMAFWSRLRHPVEKYTKTVAARMKLLSGSKETQNMKLSGSYK